MVNSVPSRNLDSFDSPYYCKTLISKGSILYFSRNLSPNHISDWGKGAVLKLEESCTKASVACISLDEKRFASCKANLKQECQKLLFELHLGYFESL